jgi:E3 ubiquitin-protein ligase MARCH6
MEPQEEITWSKLLGLDGSFRFLEHVLWVICMNSLVVFVFVYLPYQFGYILSRLSLTWYLFNNTPYTGAVVIFIGYLVYVGLTVFGYWLAKFANIPRMKVLIGFSYVALKVGLILSVEAGIFPLLCGWWMDICSFSLFGTVFKDRQVALRKIPGTVTFIHWLVGMVYIFYFASFVMLLREVLRPGVLWFLRNLNDQNFHPIQEMILLPMSRQIRRFLMSSVMFGSSVLVVVWLPVRMVQKVFPGFLPYHLSLSSSVDPLREVQLELILLHIVLPTVLEQSNTKAALLYLVKLWSKIGASVFDLKSYLLDLPQAGGRVVDMHGTVLYELPDGTPQPGPVYGGNPQVLGPGFAPFKPYLRPRYFVLKLLGFLSFTVLSLVLFSCLILTIPVLAGRLLLSVIGISPVPDLYASAIGFYTVWIICRLLYYLWDHLKQGLEGFLLLAKFVVLTGAKCVVAGALLFGVIPLLLGVLCDVMVFVPIRVPLERTPVYFLTTDWALGLLHTKCVCGVVWLGNSTLKQNLDRIYRNGIRNMNLKFIVTKVAIPVILYLSLALVVPYVFVHGIVPQFTYFGLPFATVNYIQRRVYPFIAISVLGTVIVLSMLMQFRGVYRRIRDERYLIGQRLMNYTQRRENNEPLQ